MTSFTLTKPRLLFGTMLTACLLLFVSLKSSADPASPPVGEAGSNHFATIMLVLALVIVAVTSVLLYRTIAQRERLERKLEYTQRKADESATIKDQFMANMSHEIRTPLNAIIGFGNRLGNTSLNGEQREYVKAIQNSGQALLNIINDILDFSKIESGQARLEELQLSIRELLHSVKVMFAENAREKNNQLVFHVADNLPEYVLGDASRLTQILVNIIGNAIKFTKDGSVEVITEVLKESQDRITIQFKIKDTGIGIPTEKLTDIFERFTQEKSDSSRLYGGTGLGLSIAKKLIEMQGGFITASSIQGKGATFTLFIPFKKAPDTQNIPATSSEIPPDARHLLNVLVVEDNLLNQKLATYMLKDWGFKYEVASNGRKALEKLRDQPFDLVLMDIQMPELNGYQTTQMIRKELRLDVPILAMTAHALPGEKEKCINYGMNDYISKPIKEHDLYTLVNRYINPDNPTKKKGVTT